MQINVEQVTKMQDVLQDPSSALPVEKLYTMKALD